MSYNDFKNIPFLEYICRQQYINDNIFYLLISQLFFAHYLYENILEMFLNINNQQSQVQDYVVLIILLIKVIEYTMITFKYKIHKKIKVFICKKNINTL